MIPFSSGLSQFQELRQELRANPRLYQSMELLYMPLLELQKQLESELEENPFLELTESDGGEESDQAEDIADREVEVLSEKEDEEGSLDVLSWEHLDLGDEQNKSFPNAEEDRDFWERPTVESVDLRGHLTGQLRLILGTERDVRVGEEIIGNLSDEGMLTCELQEILSDLNSWLLEMRSLAEQGSRDPEENTIEMDSMSEINTLFAPYSMIEVRESLNIIQSLDPPGVGARDIKESILIQLERRGQAGGLSYGVVSSHFDELLNHRWEDVAKDKGIHVRKVQEIADEIATLDPKPGLKYSIDPDIYIVPDLIVEEVDGEWLVFSNDTHLPRLQIAQSYKKLLKESRQLDRENKDFVARKIKSAHWMIQAIEQRRQTMIKVMRFLVEKQSEFFINGIEYLKPLTLREVADYIQVHESTVSRVVNQKYVQTPRGVFSLKYFFSSGIRITGGELISAKGVQSKIRKLIERENLAAPLSDQSIKRNLETDGIHIARRTVAKYRNQLGIPSARVRKRIQ